MSRFIYQKSRQQNIKSNNYSGSAGPSHTEEAKIRQTSGGPPYTEKEKYQANGVAATDKEHDLEG